MLSDKYKLAKLIVPEYSHSSPSELCQHLYSQGYYWNSNAAWWAKKREREDRIPRQNEVQLRITADSKIIKSFTTRLLQFLESEGYNLDGFNKKDPPMYPCRHSNANNKRTYLTIGLGN